MFKPLIFAFNIPFSEIYKPRAHSMLTSLLCCNLDILQQTHRIKYPSNVLRGIHDHLCIYFTIVIGFISINLCLPIYILLVLFTSIALSLKHTNKPYNINKTLPVITFFPDPHNGFNILHINIMVDVSNHFRTCRLS